MSVLLLPPIFQFFDNNGDPLANGFVYTYAAGTSTPLATFTSSSGLIAAPNPIELNASGRPTSGSGAIWGEGAYKFIVRDANGVQVGDTLDNVTSFNSLADAANAYAETFSGNGVQTVFTTSQSLGTDPKGLFVSTASGLQEIAVNGSFSSDTSWTKGAGWTIASGVATATGAISTAISQVPVITLVAGQAYAVTYTITRSAGGLIPSLGGQNGTERTASGTYREIIIAAATTPVAFTGNAFTGTLDNVSITVATSQPMVLLPVTGYTISGTTLTFASPPALGTNNIDVRSPSLLLGAAASSAALAQLYAGQALTSATNAATSAVQALSVSKWKPAVACATTANITLSGEQTIDGVLTSAFRVLVKDQSTANQNGVYVSAAGAWARASDADTASELLSQLVQVTSGTVNSSKYFANTNESGFILGVDAVTWTEISFTGSVPFVNPTAIVAAYLDIKEATNNGTNRLRLTVPTSLGFDATCTLPFAGGTLVAEDNAVALTNKTYNGVTLSTAGNTTSYLSAAGTYITAFTSTAQTITSGGLLTLAHGLGRKPDEFYCWLTNVTTQANWVATDVVPIGVSPNYGGTGIQQCIYADTTNVYVRFGSDSSPYAIGNKSTGAQAVLTNANWTFSVRAR